MADEAKQIKIQDNFAGSEYTNIAQAGYTKEEVLLTFLNVVPPAGRVVGKIMTSPGHLKRIIRLLQDTMKRYEDQYGEVKEADAPGQELGFHA